MRAMGASEREIKREKKKERWGAGGAARLTVSFGSEEEEQEEEEQQRQPGSVHRSAARRWHPSAGGRAGGGEGGREGAARWLTGRSESGGSRRSDARYSQPAETQRRAAGETDSGCGFQDHRDTTL